MRRKKGLFPVNTWVRRSLQASIIAGGFVVLGAGVANAAEPGGVVGQVTDTAKSTVDQATEQDPATNGVTDKATKTAKVTKQTVKKQADAVQEPVAPADDPVQSATREVTKTAGKVVDDAQPQPMEPARKAAPEQRKAERVEAPVVNELPVADRTVDELPATATTAAMPRLDVVDDSIAADVVGTVTATADETVPASVDLGDHGAVDSVTDVAGNLDGMTDITATENGLDGITSVSGVLDTASTLTADVPGVASVFAASSTIGTVDGLLLTSADLTRGDLSALGNVTSTLDSANVVDVDAGDLGYLTTTADVSGWADAVGTGYASLRTGDVSGFLAAAGMLDAVVTADGQLADLAGLSGVVTASAVADGFLSAVGNLYDGDLAATGALFATLDSTVDAQAWAGDVADVTLDAVASSVVDETLDLLEVDL